MSVRTGGGAKCHRSISAQGRKHCCHDLWGRLLKTRPPREHDREADEQPCHREGQVSLYQKQPYTIHEAAVKSSYKILKIVLVNAVSEKPRFSSNATHDSKNHRRNGHHPAVEPALADMDKSRSIYRCREYLPPRFIVMNRRPIKMVHGGKKCVSPPASRAVRWDI